MQDPKWISLNSTQDKNELLNACEDIASHGDDGCCGLIAMCFSTT